MGVASMTRSCTGCLSWRRFQETLMHFRCAEGGYKNLNHGVWSEAVQERYVKR